MGMLLHRHYLEELEKQEKQAEKPATPVENKVEENVPVKANKKKK